MGKAKGRMMRASEVRTGDRIIRVLDGAERTVTQVKKRGDTVIMHHGPNATTATTETAHVRVIRSSRTVNLDRPTVVHSTSTKAA